MEPEHTRYVPLAGMDVERIIMWLLMARVSFSNSNAVTETTEAGARENNENPVINAEDGKKVLFSSPSTHDTSLMILPTY